MNFEGVLSFCGRFPWHSSKPGPLYIHKCRSPCIIPSYLSLSLYIYIHIYNVVYKKYIHIYIYNIIYIYVCVYIYIGKLQIAQHTTEHHLHALYGSITANSTCTFRSCNLLCNVCVCVCICIPFVQGCIHTCTTVPVLHGFGQQPQAHG